MSEDALTALLNRSLAGDTVAADLASAAVYDEIRAIAGVESGAQAIHQFNATASQFIEIVDQLPQRMRWQMR